MLTLYVNMIWNSQKNLNNVYIYTYIYIEPEWILTYLNYYTILTQRIMGI